MDVPAARQLLAHRHPLPCRCKSSQSVGAAAPAAGAVCPANRVHPKVIHAREGANGEGLSGGQPERAMGCWRRGTHRWRWVQHCFRRWRAGRWGMMWRRPGPGVRWRVLLAQGWRRALDRRGWRTADRRGCWHCQPGSWQDPRPWCISGRHCPRGTRFVGSHNVGQGACWSRVASRPGWEGRQGPNQQRQAAKTAARCGVERRRQHWPPGVDIVL